MSQIFKTHVDKNLLNEFLDSVCIKNENHYIYNLSSYKKGGFDDINDNFCKKINYYYYLSKQVYCTKKNSYNKFATIIRQLCKLNNISFTTKVIYNKSQYNIHYYIYF